MLISMHRERFPVISTIGSDFEVGTSPYHQVLVVGCYCDDVRPTRKDISCMGSRRGGEGVASINARLNGSRHLHNDKVIGVRTGLADCNLGKDHGSAGWRAR